MTLITRLAGRTIRLGSKIQHMKRALTLVAATMALVFAAPANADVDTDFTNQLHTYGLYGQRDFNAWIGKITCERLRNGIDADAYASVSFLSKNLPRNSTTAQQWQFLGAAIDTYCPDQRPVLERVAGQQH
jgi:Protein of unknown function (DUF732)